MHSRAVITFVLVIVCHLFSLSSASIVPATEDYQQHEPRATYPKTILGSEDASDPATTGFFINHISLNVRNMTQSVDFYTSVFGMRLLFTVQISPHASLSYVGHSNGGKNGTGYQTTEELNRDKNNAQGLIELISMDLPGAAGNSSTEVQNTFSAIGMVVPDLKRAEERLDKFGVDIYKRTGGKLPKEGPISRAGGLSGDLSGLDEGEFDDIWAVMNKFTTDSIYAGDPDGNLLAIQGPLGPQL